MKTHLHIILHNIFDRAHLIDDIGTHQLLGGLALERGDRVVKLQIEWVDLPRRCRLLLLDVSGSVGGGGRVAARVVAHLCNQPQRRCPRHHRRRRRRRRVLQEADHGQRRHAALAQLLAGATSSRNAPQKRHRFGESAKEEVEEEKEEE